MPKRSRQGLATAGLLLGLVACGGDPGAELRSDVGAVTDAANARNVADLRGRIADLEVTVADQVERGALEASEAEQIRALAVRVADGAQLLQEPLPAPPEAEVVEPPPPAPDPADEVEESKPDERGKGHGNGQRRGKVGD